MRASGPRTAVAVTRIVSARGSSLAAPPPAMVALLAATGAERRLPGGEELEALLRVEVGHDLGAHRDRLHVRSELRVELLRRVLGVHVVADRQELDFAADHLLAPLRQ